MGYFPANFSTLQGNRKVRREWFLDYRSCIMVSIFPFNFILKTQTPILNLSNSLINCLTQGSNRDLKIIEEGIYQRLNSGNKEQIIKIKSR